MNNLLIDKLIKLHNNECPDITYTSPLLDRKIADALSKSLIKLLNISTQNSNLNNNSRILVLESIRKLCTVQPENHLEIDEYTTELLTAFYEKSIQETIQDNIDDVDKNLEKFFIRNYKEIDIKSSLRCSINPEVIQALVNLNPSSSFLNTLSKTIIQWNFDDSQFLLLAQKLWKNENYIENYVTNDLCIKLKFELEVLLLDISYSALEKPDNYKNTLSYYPQLKNIIKICSSSCDCFQICCSIFNFILIASKFAPQLRNLIESFICDIKLQCMDKTIAVLYPTHLTSIVVLLDIDFSELPTTVKSSYIQSTVKHLRSLQNSSETDLILLLSHFPNWFDIYFS